MTKVNISINFKNANALNYFNLQYFIYNNIAYFFLLLLLLIIILQHSQSTITI